MSLVDKINATFRHIGSRLGKIKEITHKIDNYYYDFISLRRVKRLVKKLGKDEEEVKNNPDTVLEQLIKQELQNYSPEIKVDDMVIQEIIDTVQYTPKNFNYKNLERYISSEINKGIKIGELDSSEVTKMLSEDIYNLVHGLILYKNRLENPRTSKKFEEYLKVLLAAGTVAGALTLVYFLGGKLEEKPSEIVENHRMPEIINYERNYIIGGDYTIKTGKTDSDYIVAPKEIPGSRVRIVDGKVVEVIMPLIPDEEGYRLKVPQEGYKAEFDDGNLKPNSWGYEIRIEDRARGELLYRAITFGDEVIIPKDVIDNTSINDIGVDISRVRYLGEVNGKGVYVRTHSFDWGVVEINNGEDGNNIGTYGLQGRVEIKNDNNSGLEFLLSLCGAALIPLIPYLISKIPSSDNSDGSYLIEIYNQHIRRGQDKVVEAARELGINSWDEVKEGIINYMEDLYVDGFNNEIIINRYHNEIAQHLIRDGKSLKDAIVEAYQYSDKTLKDIADDLSRLYGMNVSASTVSRIAREELGVKNRKEVKNLTV